MPGERGGGFWDFGSRVYFGRTRRSPSPDQSEDGVSDGRSRVHPSGHAVARSVSLRSAVDCGVEVRPQVASGCLRCAAAVGGGPQFLVELTEKILGVLVSHAGKENRVRSSCPNYPDNQTFKTTDFPTPSTQVFDFLREGGDSYPADTPKRQRRRFQQVNSSL